MHDSLMSENTGTDDKWSSTSMMLCVQDRHSRFFDWWYRLTSVPEPPSSMSFAQREAVRRMRLYSMVVFFLILTLVLFLLPFFFLANRAVFYIDSAVILIAVFTLWLNRIGHFLSAGIVLVVAFECALCAIILTTRPFDEMSIQLYDLFVIGELLAVSLLPVRYVFLLAFCNCVFIWIALTYQLQTVTLAHALQTHFLPVLVYPVGLQIIVAGVAYLWVYTTSRAIARADRAEMVATLEHTLVEQKKELESGIEQILQTHVAVANGDLQARAPLTQEHSLWQLARALNTLLVRLQRASLAERELQRIEQAITTTINIIQRAEQLQIHPLLPFTQTELDLLIVALQGKTLAYTKSSVLPYHSSFPGASTALHTPQYMPPGNWQNL